MAHKNADEQWLCSPEDLRNPAVALIMKYERKLRSYFESKGLEAADACCMSYL